MDSLDFNVHSAILTALAQSYAHPSPASSNQEPTPVLRDLPQGPQVASDVDAVASHAVSGTSAPGVLGAFAPDSLNEGAHSLSCSQGRIRREKITCSQAHHTIAYAAYVSSVAAQASSIQPHVFLRLLSLLTGLPDWDVEDTLTIERPTDFPLVDELARRLVSALLEVGATDPSQRSRVCTALEDFQSKLAGGLQQSGSELVIRHYLPLISGFRRAVVETAFPWTPSLFATAFPSAAASPLVSPDIALVERVDLVCTGAIDSTASAGRHLIGILNRYESMAQPLSMGLVVHATMQAMRAALQQTLLGQDWPPKLGLAGPALKDGWARLVEGVGASGTSRGEGQLAVGISGERAVEIYDESIQIFNASRGTSPAHSSVSSGLGQDDGRNNYILNIASEALKVATTSSLVLNQLDRGLLAILDQIHSEQSPVHDPLVSVTATECLVVLAQHFRGSLVASVGKTWRRYISTPNPLFDTRGPPSDALLAAAHGLVVCVQLSQDTTPEFATAMLYSLLSRIKGGTPGTTLGGVDTKSSVSSSRRESDARSTNSAAGGSRTDEDARLASISSVQAVAAMVAELQDPEATSLAVSLLTQSLRGSDSYLEAAVLLALAQVAVYADESTQEDVFATLSMVSKSAVGPEVASAVLSAQTSLAGNLLSEPRACKSYLKELLKLFVAKSIAVQATKRAGGCTGVGSFNEDLSRVATLVPVIGTLLYANTEYSPRYTEDEELLALFRNFWFISVQFGFLTPRSQAVSDWCRSSLARIALKSPTLSHGAPLDYLANELEYNTLLRLDPKVAAKEDPQKVELGGELPSHAGQIRSLTHAQATFLLAVLRVEELRAAALAPSGALEYVISDAIQTSQLFDCVSSVADKVLTTFIGAFQQQAGQHRVDVRIYRELRCILKACCHHVYKVRAVALRYAGRLITAFPTLLCHEDTVTMILECLTLLRRSCEGEYEDEYAPAYSFHSRRADLTLSLPDDYTTRTDVLKDLHVQAQSWLSIAVDRAPLEMQSLLQRYINSAADLSIQMRSEMGTSVALDLARMIPPTTEAAQQPRWGGWRPDDSAAFASSFGHRSFYSGEAEAIVTNASEIGFDLPSISNVKADLRQLADQLSKGNRRASPEDLPKLLYRAGAVVAASAEPDYEILHRIVQIPIHIFTPAALLAGTKVWTWLIDVKPNIEAKVTTDIISLWGWTIRRKRGLFSPAMNPVNPLDRPIQFVPTDKGEVDHQAKAARRLLMPHSLLLDFLSSRFQASRYRNRSVVLSMLRLVYRSLSSHSTWSTHPLARELRLRILTFGFALLQSSRMEASVEFQIREKLYDAAFSWFNQQPVYAYGSSRAQHETDARSLRDLAATVKLDNPSADYIISSLESSSPPFLPGRHTLKASSQRHSDRHHLLQLLIENELLRLAVWLNPLNDVRRGKDPVPTVAAGTSEATWLAVVQAAWAASPHLAVRLVVRFKLPVVQREVRRLVRQHPERARRVPEALPFFISDRADATMDPLMKHVLYWRKIPVVDAITYFLPQYENNPMLLQFAMRVLEEHPVEVVFFYIPQVVQALRTDRLGYIERFICETANVSQLFCHQIIWNMKANTHKGDAGEEEDPMKPHFDRMINLIVQSLSGEAKEFYEREFGFFDEVTSISRKLKEYLKRSKAEKKAKITEELAKIKVKKGVYLPSNPDGSVVDIDRNSGRPLQSHAKTPFMATFKVHRERTVHYGEDDLPEVGPATADVKGFDQWQAAIFKVGDDCRQDVLALQLIAMHKTIYESVSLDVHLVPYRVTATAPGCGVIDVIPNSTSRDEMGRAQINDLNTFFIGKFGQPTTPAYQIARMNFIRSMAAYSVMCYLIQIKDRHNGNIMIDGNGHITHIDFGFLFDIGPGGIKFEPHSFKLTHEMINVMGGFDSPGYRQFQELTVKAFLAARPFAKEIVSTVRLMSGTELPSFKGEGTMIRLMDRFKPDMTEREAATWMQGLIAHAETNRMTIVYDQFQLVTNQIPYAK